MNHSRGVHGATTQIAWNCKVHGFLNRYARAFNVNIVPKYVPRICYLTQCCRQAHRGGWNGMSAAWQKPPSNASPKRSPPKGTNENCFKIQALATTFAKIRSGITRKSFTLTHLLGISNKGLARVKLLVKEWGVELLPTVSLLLCQTHYAEQWAFLTLTGSLSIPTMTAAAVGWLWAFMALRTCSPGICE